MSYKLTHPQRGVVTVENKNRADALVARGFEHVKSTGTRKPKAADTSSDNTDNTED